MKILPHLPLSCLLAAAISAGLLTPSLPAQTPAELAVLAPVNAMFDGMTKRDSAIIKDAFIPGATLVLMREGTPAQMTCRRLRRPHRPPRPPQHRQNRRAHPLAAHPHRQRSRRSLGPLRLPHRRQSRPLRHRPLQPRPQRRQVAHRQRSRYRPQRLPRKIIRIIRAKSSPPAVTPYASPTSPATQPSQSLPPPAPPPAAENSSAIQYAPQSPASS